MGKSTGCNCSGEGGCNFQTITDVSFLPEEERRMFYLRHRLGRSSAQVGATCGISPWKATVKLFEIEEKVHRHFILGG